MNQRTSCAVEIRSGRYVTCRSINPSQREEAPSVGGKSLLGTSKRAIDIFVHQENNECFLFWRGRMSNASERTGQEVWLHPKRLTQAIVMGQLFKVKPDRLGKCTWYTLNEEAFHPAVLCKSTTGVIGNKCGYIQT